MTDRKITTCKHCGAEHLSFAERCPRCGRPTASTLPPQPRGRDRMMRGSKAIKRVVQPVETPEESDSPKEE